MVGGTTPEYIRAASRPSHGSQTCHRTCAIITISIAIPLFFALTVAFVYFFWFRYWLAKRRTLKAQKSGNTREEIGGNVQQDRDAGQEEYEMEGKGAEAEVGSVSTEASEEPRVEEARRVPQIVEPESGVVEAQKGEKEVYRRSGGYEYQGAWTSIAAGRNQK